MGAFESGFSIKGNKQQIKNDVFVLQSAPDAEAFDHAVLLFLEKWGDIEEDFCTYFKSTWLGETTRNWYAGYSPFVPDHNNGVEGTNNSIKRDFTLRERLPLNTFKIKVLDMVHQMSMRYDPNEEEDAKKIEFIPKITNKLCREAFSWYASSPTVTIFEDRDEFVIYLTANKGTSDELMELKQKRYETFDDYKKNRDAVFTIKFCNEKKRWMTESICTCKFFQKSFVCKHIVGLAFYNKLKKCPQEGNGELISKLPKRGRVARAKSALQKQ